MTFTQNPRAAILEQRAHSFEKTVERSMVDPRGLLLSLIDIRSMKSFPAGHFDEGQSIHRYPGACYGDFSGYLDYENVGMVTGAYLCAQVWKYHATGLSSSLKTAGRCFAALRDLYEQCQTVERGYFCKNYGSRLSDQTSSDQYLYVMAALDAYAAVAGPEDSAVCSRMIGEMAQWWIRRDYHYPYFGRPLDWPRERFPVFAFLAYRHTGDRAFLNEFDRLCLHPQVREALPFSMRWDALLANAHARLPVYDFEKRTSKRLVGYKVEGTGSGFLSLSAMLEYEAPHGSLWRSKAAALFDTGSRGIAEDGLGMECGLLDLETHQWQELRQVIHDGLDHPTWRFLGFKGWIRSGMTAAMAARAAVGMQPHLKEHDTLSLAADILHGIDHDRLRWRIDMDGQQLPPSLKWVNDVFSGDAITNWLWAYWEARARYKTIG